MTEKQEQKELNRAAARFEEQCKQGLFLDGSIKFAEFAEKWVKEYAEKQLRAKTVFSYRNMLVPINENIGHLRLDRIQPHHLLEMYDAIESKGQRRDPPVHAKKAFTDAFSALGISRKAFASLSGTAQSTVHAALNGEALSPVSAQKLSAALGKSASELFTQEQARATVSGKTLQNYHRLVSSILETAVKWQVILSNPCSRVRSPKAERKEAKYLDEKQAAELLVALESEPLKFRTLYTLLLYSGMRRGEALALTWKDIDFENGIIDINKSLLYLPKKGLFDDKTKTASSVRSIRVPAPALELLAEWKRAQRMDCLHSGTAWLGDRTGTGKVFTRDNGLPIFPDTVSILFHDFVVRHNLPPITVHSLRHTNGTLLIASGVDLRTVSKRLGPAQTSTTVNIYTHAIRTADELASEALGDILTPRKAAMKKA